MSIPKKMTVNCTKCGHPFSVTVFESVNTDYSDDIAMQIISGKLFDAECPKCGEVSHLEYDLLYNDMQHDAMIWVINKRNEDYSSKVETARSTGAMVPNKTLRIVENMNALKEKVSALESGRDDRIIELYKWFIYGNLLSQCPDFAFRNAFYTIYSGKETFYLYDVDGNYKCCDLTEDIYNYLKDLYFSSPYAEQFDGNFAIVDADWAEEVLMPLISEESDLSHSDPTEDDAEVLMDEETTKTIVCPKCKNVLPTDSEFCQYCGYKINDCGTPQTQKAQVPVKSTNTSPQAAVASNTAQKTAQLSDIATPISAKKSKQRFCKYCGGAIDQESKKCISCGKQYFKPPKTQSKAFLVVIIVLFILFAIGGFFGFNYYKGVDAMNNQQFIVAQQYFDNLIISDKLFPDKCAYIDAGVLKEEGKYIESLKAFNKLDSIPVPVSITESLKAKIYSAGQEAYREDDRAIAKKYFNSITSYKKTSSYLALISAKESTFIAESDYARLVKLIGFEDADEVILKYESTAEKFLEGRWENGERNPYYFELYEKDGSLHTKYNLPCKDSSGYYYISDGIYSLGDDWFTSEKQFKFSILTEDVISVYCYKDGSTHRLYRQ